MSVTPEHKVDPPVEREVRWIGREPLTDTAAVPVATGVDAPRSARIKWIAAVAFIAIGLAAAGLWKRMTPTPVPTTLAGRDSIPLVSVIAPTLKPVPSSISFTGTITARYDMPIGIEGDAGRIIAVNVEAGDHVRRGQVLAQLDTSVLLPQVNRLAASLELARAQAALSAAEYRRAKGVEAAGALSAEDIEKRRAASLTNEASVKVAVALLAEAQARLERARILAPESGVVLTRNAEVGQTASPGGSALFRLARGGEIEMRGQVAEQDLAAVAVGQPASVYLTGLSQSFTGKVRLLGAVIDTASRLGDIRIALKPDPALRPGAFARGTVTVANVERPILPQTAVLSDDQGTYVFVIEGNRVVRRAVRVTGTTEDGVIIASGLTGTERVVATAGGFLRDGENVTVAPAKRLAAGAAS